MKQKLKSLRVRMLLPVVAMTLFVVILLTTLFSRAYTGMILRQEQEVNAVGFETVSHSFGPEIESSVSEVRSLLSDSRVVSYIQRQYGSAAEEMHGRISCRDCLRGEITRHDGIFGLLFMRKDGSLFGALPEGNLFLDDPADNPLPEAIRTQILNLPHGQTVWAGPVSGEDLYGFRNANTPERIMIAAWKNVDVSYGECYALMLLDESIFARQFSTLQDGKSTWHLFTEDYTEICHTGDGECADAELLIGKSNTGEIFNDGNGASVCTFSMTMESPAWILVREVSMEENEQVVRGVRGSVAALAGIVFLVALVLYELWLKKYMRQFGNLLKGITRMGQSDSEPITEKPSSITEFATMQAEINRTSLALNGQMNTIREMTAEKERISTELDLAARIQSSMLPHIFPPFPDRKEFDLFASMDPAKEVGGDFYDFFLIDSDHLGLVMADVSGKGVPAALFMMASKIILQSVAMMGVSAGEILTKTNEAVCSDNQAEMFVTVWAGILEISTGKLTAANAGHEYPALKRKDGSFELFKDKHGFVIGGMEGVRYKEYELQLNPGDQLFVYTDGVPEATDAGGGLFGTDRMIDALNRCPDADPEEQIRCVREAVDRFVGDADQFDDITMLCFRYLGPQGREGEA